MNDNGRQKFEFLENSNMARAWLRDRIGRRSDWVFVPLDETGFAACRTFVKHTGYHRALYIPSPLFQYVVIVPRARLEAPALIEALGAAAGALTVESVSALDMIALGEGGVNDMLAGLERVRHWLEVFELESNT